MQNLIAFCKQFENISYQNLNLIIFTDESTIVNCAHHSGICRYPDHHPPESFIDKESHPLQVMIWGGISKVGFRTSLLWFSNRVTKENYVSQLENNRIFQNINLRFGRS